MTLLCEIQGPSQPRGARPSARVRTCVASSMSARSAGSSHSPLALRVAAPVRHDLVAPRAERRRQVRAMIVDRTVDERCAGQTELVEEVEHAPRADAVAVLAPRPVQHVGLPMRWRALGAQSFAEREMLEVDGDVAGQARATRPGELRTIADRRIGEAPVIGQRGHAPSFPRAPPGSMRDNSASRSIAWCFSTPAMWSANRA